MSTPAGPGSGLPRMPEVLTRRATALAYGDGATWTPPPARPASTVVLLRDHAEGGVEAYLMRRVPTMAFAAGMHVFPGGRVDPRDADPAIPWIPSPGLDAAAEAARVSAAPDLARSLVVCGVRETFEETGVLLAAPAGGAPAGGAAGGVAAGPDDTWETDRQGLLAGTIGFADLLISRGLVVDPAVLPAWSHWVTPEVEDRRYDVRFYVAVLPEGQQAVDVGGEADRVHWVRPADALAAYRAGTMPMLPPTSATLAELAAYESAAQVLADAPARPIRPLLPRALPDGDGGVTWVLVDARDGTVVWHGDGEPPAGSESMGVNG